jgi:hypothetical protein
MPATMIRESTHRLSDPAERWELECQEPAPTASPRGAYDVFPYTPRRADDVPRDALEALRNQCSVEGLERLLVVPRAVRYTGRGDHRVISPRSFLGIGTQAVGLWTEEPVRGIKVLIPVDRLGAIEDVTILLYGRLSFVSFAERLTIRYNTLARPGLWPALLSLRQTLATAPLPLPQDDAPRAQLPIKWERVLGSPMARFHEGAPLLYRFAVERRRTAEDVDRGQMLVVNPHELVYICDPPAASHNYGEDSVVIPRARITRVRVQEKHLEIACNGARLSLDMTPELREAAARWLAR